MRNLNFFFFCIEFNYVILYRENNKYFVKIEIKFCIQLNYIYLVDVNRQEIQLVLF